MDTSASGGREGEGGAPRDQPAGDAVTARLGAMDWNAVHVELDDRGFACIKQLLREDECACLRDMFDDEARFRSQVVMQRHGFGRGEYRYFADPLPELVAELRSRAYPNLVPIANDWARRLGQARTFPSTLLELAAQCRAAGQTRPTPLLLRYRQGDYNCLHQDLYGEITFPLQIAILLSSPQTDFGGGEFVLTEQRPRMQSRVDVVPLCRGDAVIFAVNARPVRGTQRDYRVRMRHGVSRLAHGERLTLGIIFHDAE